MGTIIPSGTNYNLRVHFDAVLREKADPIEDINWKLPSQHALSKIGVCGMDRNVLRRQSMFGNSL